MTSFLAMLQMPAFVKDKTVRLLYINRSAARLWKVDGEESIGKGMPVGRQLEKHFRESDRKVIQRTAADVFFFPFQRPHLTVLQFAHVDPDGHRVIVGLVLTHG